MGTTASVRSWSSREVAESRVIVIARYLRAGTWALLSVNALIFLFVAAVLFRSPVAPGGSPLPESLIDDGRLVLQLRYETGDLTLRSKLLVLGYFAALVLFLTYCFVKLHRLFGNFRDGQIFVAGNSSLLRGLGYALAIGYLSGGLLRYALLLAVAAQGPSGFSFAHVPIPSLTVGTDQLLGALTIGMVFLSAWILDIGRDFYEETELTI